MSLSEELRGLVKERSLLKHPFYEAWSKGELSLDVLRSYAAQYFRQVEAFPRYVSSVHSRCPDLSARKVLLENLVEEELHGTDHPSLWLQFAEGLGVSESTVRETRPLPETESTVDSYYQLTSGDWREGLCALYAYEAQVPEVSESKMDGLRKFYGISDDRALAFFSSHMKYDVEHTRAVGALIDQHGRPGEAHRATVKATDALWKFLDGMCQEAHISCH
jgi:pyrroloquinoline-quinone synthase